MQNTTILVPLVSSFLSMPIIGYGTWQSSGNDLSQGVEEALNAGYRHIDCAAVYQNEHIIGEILSRWLSDGRIKREDLYIVSKLPPVGMRPSSVSKYLDKTLKDLKLDYLDLYLVHTPFGFVEGDDLHPFNEDGTIKQDNTTDHIAIWKEMEKQVTSGKVKAIGLSNFNSSQIQRIIDNSSIKPVNLQVEMHLYHQQKEIRNFCNSKNISITAYSPLGTRGTQKLLSTFGIEQEFPDLFNQPAVLKLAEKYKKTSGQILLKHLISKGVAVIPKSTTPKHIKENIDILDFTLTKQDISELDSLDQGANGRLLDFRFFKGITDHPEYPF